MSEITGSIEVADLSASVALRQYAGMQQLRGKSITDTMRKVMRYWVSFAIAKIKPGDAEKINREMQNIVTNYSRLGRRRSKAADAWKGTYAAMLVAVLNWRGARKMKGAGFYSRARMFASRRVFSANLHKAGMRPAMMRLRANINAAGKLPNYGKEPPGGFEQKTLDRVAEILVENWAKAGSKRSVGIAALHGDAFNAALPEVEAMLTEFFAKDITEVAEKLGLTVQEAMQRAA